MRRCFDETLQSQPVSARVALSTRHRQRALKRPSHSMSNIHTVAIIHTEGGLHYEEEKTRQLI
jgi:hypothetical protein